MAGSTSVALLRDIQTLFDAGTAAGLSDRQLLERFAGRRDAAAEAAFEVLVLRHGPMVLRVCRNVLHDPNDVQDAFQATFLVLVRRRGAVRRLESLGGWLYGVANRVAARARVEAARRRAVEGRAALRVVEAFEPSSPLEAEQEEFGPIVQEEVRRLPEKYRSAVVLCYWQGLTQEQAAVQLGIPLGTVRSRVARARDLLRRRLARRRSGDPLAGVVVDGPGLFTSSHRNAAARPGTSQTGAGDGPGSRASGRRRQAANPSVSGTVASLVQRVIWSMMMIKIGGIAAGVVLVGLAGYGVGIAGQADPGPIRQSRIKTREVTRSDRAGGRDRAGDQSATQQRSGRTRSREERLRPFRGTLFQEQWQKAGRRDHHRRRPTGRLRGQEGRNHLRAGFGGAARRALVNQRITTQGHAEVTPMNAKLGREEAELALFQYIGKTSCLARKGRPPGKSRSRRPSWRWPRKSS